MKVYGHDVPRIIIIFNFLTIAFFVAIVWFASRV
jgi:hypothetical protein